MTVHVPHEGSEDLKFVATYLKDAHTQVKLFAPAGTFLRELDLPGIGTAEGFGGRRIEQLEPYQIARLGLGTPHPVSAIHGRGSGDLLDAVVDALPPEPEAPSDDADDGIFSIAIVGRPNVGKSTLVNRLIGEERVIATDTPPWISKSA